MMSLHSQASPPSLLLPRIWGLTFQLALPNYLLTWLSPLLPSGLQQLTFRPPRRIALMLPKLCPQSPLGLTLLLPIPKRHLLTTLTLR